MAAKPQGDCFHCGEPIPVKTNYVAIIQGETQKMCCAGCQAVAQLITEGGLDNFYQLRTALNIKPLDASVTSDFSAYDLSSNQTEFVSKDADGLMRANLLITGITCAACTWLIEKSLLSTAGVQSANVRLANGTLSVEWQEAELRLSQIFQLLSNLGYTAHPWRQAELQAALDAEERKSLSELAVAGIAMMQVGMFAIALHAGELQGIAEEYRGLLRWVSLLVSTCVVAYSARSFFRSAWNNLTRWNLVMDLPVSIAIGLAWTASAWATITNSGQVYYDSIAMFTFFLLLGRYLEQRIRRRALRRQTDLRSLLPTTAKRRSGPSWETVAISELSSGDLIEVHQGQVFPADGIVEYGEARVDESAFSGEHYPRQIIADSQAKAGTLVISGSAGVRVKAIGEDTRLAQMLELFSGAEEQKPVVQLMADKLAAWFVGLQLTIAAGVYMYWAVQSDPRALWICLSVLVVSCPCALALATPTALAAATANLRNSGFVILGPEALERIPRVNRVLFDKTGTLTHGELSISRVITLGNLDEPTCLSLAAALEQHSMHPIASAFSQYAADITVETAQQDTTGGVRGFWRGQPLRLGSPKYCLEVNDQIGCAPDEKGHWLMLCTPGAALAWIEIEDKPREDAALLVSEMQSLGLMVELLSGDSSTQVDKFAAQWGITEYRKNQSPADKLERLRQLQQGDECIAMVGDGLNDAPILAAADLSIAVADATDLAKARADVLLTTSKLETIAQGWRKAMQCRRIIRQNFCWALAYNALAVPFAAAGLVPPWAAAIGMSLSSLLVVMNSLRLN